MADLNRVELEHSDESDATAEIRMQAGPAVRKLRPGDDLNYAFVVYNARVDKASAAPRLTVQLSMFRDGKQVHAGPVNQLLLKPQPDWRRINVSGSLRLAANAEPGEYMIRLLITDTMAGKKYAAAIQWADFEIIK